MLFTKEGSGFTCGDIRGDEGVDAIDAAFFPESVIVM
jgi:hypothetical protein